MEGLKKYLEELLYSLGGALIFLIGAYLSTTDNFALLINLMLAFCCFFTTISIVIIATIDNIKRR